MIRNHFSRTKPPRSTKEYLISSLSVPGDITVGHKKIIRVKILDKTYGDIRIVMAYFVGYLEDSGGNGFFVDGLFHELQLSFSFQVVTLVERNGIPQLDLVEGGQAMRVIECADVEVDFETNEIVVGFILREKRNMSACNILLRVLDKGLIGDDGSYDETRVVVKISDGIRITEPVLKKSVQIIREKVPSFDYSVEDIVEYIEGMIVDGETLLIVRLLKQHYPDQGDLGDILSEYLLSLFEDIGYDDIDGIQNAIIKTIEIMVILNNKEKYILYRGSDDKTLLHVGSLIGYISLVEYLVNNLNIDVNLIDAYGNTSMHYACGKGFKKIADFLISKNTDLTIKNKEGNTPFAFAEQHNRSAIVKLLRNYEIKTIDISFKEPQTNDFSFSSLSSKKKRSTSYTNLNRSSGLISPLKPKKKSARRTRGKITSLDLDRPVESSDSDQKET
eukprot:TRINITY_DN6773_c0_g1_i1.p1 TRINITY_DN6773_c0_g1~~TRINITY_DN6773_c0_g1_i1.p1  ORF type:complete len:464 (-),score=102.98 TRINITY_DN6773_c0_g1_i1:854-2191(-)